MEEIKGESRGFFTTLKVTTLVILQDRLRNRNQSPRVPLTERQKVSNTITCPGLDDPGCPEIRARHYQQYCEELYTEDFLKGYSPFVWHEANRQGLL